MGAWQGKRGRHVEKVRSGRSVIGIGVRERARGCGSALNQGAVQGKRGSMEMGDKRGKRSRGIGERREWNGEGMYECVCALVREREGDSPFDVLRVQLREHAGLCHTGRVRRERLGAAREGECESEEATCEACEWEREITCDLEDLPY